MSIYRNYLKISIRNIFKQKLYSGINIGGLTAGFTIFILIMLYVNHEYSYDGFYEGGDRVYRVYQQQIGRTMAHGDYFGVTPTQLAGVMREELAEIESATTVDSGPNLLRVGDRNFWEEGILGDEKFFDVFKIPFLKGNRDKALDNPNSIVLTISLARKLFGDKEALGAQIKYDTGDFFTVTGIVGDMPANSSLAYSFIANINADSWYRTQSRWPKWTGSSFTTFVKLHEGTDRASVEAKFPDLITKYQDPVAYANYPYKDVYYLQPLADLHLTSISADIGVKGSKRTVNLLMIVAIIILALAAVNYINLAIARSIKRAREVGLRKAIGAVKQQIIAQFLSESLLFSMFSLLLAAALAYLLLPSFGNMMERKLSIDYLDNPILLPGLSLLTIIIGILSGSYPAFVMSSLRPVQVLKGKIGGISGGNLQRLLLIGQYSISIVLIVCSLGIYLQNEFIQNKELGYNPEYVVSTLARDYRVLEHREVLKTEWLTNPNIHSVTVTNSLPINVRSSHAINDPPGTPIEGHLHVYELHADYDLLDVYNITLLAGRYYSEEFPNENSESYVINETAAKALGWTPEEAIGKQVWDERQINIIGVVKDFHLHSLHLAIQPLVIKLRGNLASYFSLKISSNNVQETLAFIDEVLKKRSPYPFSYEFVDDRYNQLYKSEANLGKIFGWFTVLSVLIASMGLFGLAAFMSAQRTKEIGVRKVLGASVKNIVVLLTRDFLIMVVIAFVVSIPLAWYSMSKWLETFAYRIDMPWWMFGGAGFLAVFIALFSVGYLSVKASMANPVDSLKAE